MLEVQDAEANTNTDNGLKTPVVDSSSAPIIAPDPIPEKPKSKKKKIVAIIIVVLLLVAGAAIGAWQFIENKDDDTQKEAPASVVESTENIFYINKSTLYAYNLATKKISEVDSKVTANNSGGMGVGSANTLTSRNLKTVAYLKDNDVWIKDGDNDPKKISQPSQVNDGDRYMVTWSSDAKYLVYSIGTSCLESTIDEGGCEPDPADKDVVGIYLYSVDSNESTKLSIPRADSWLPNSNKLVYFTSSDNLYSMHTYDVISKVDSVVTKTYFLSDPVLDFSDDGTKIIYSSNDIITIADIDNTNQKPLQIGEENILNIQSPVFLAGSDSDFAFTLEKHKTCEGGVGICPQSYLFTTINNQITQITETEGFRTIVIKKDMIATVRGDVVTPTQTLSLVNTSTGEIVDILQSDEPIWARTSGY